MSIDPDEIDQRYLDAIADADQYPYWYEDVDEPDSNPTLVRTESLRPVRRRRRLHRSLDRDHRQGARPVARRGADRRPRVRSAPPAAATAGSWTPRSPTASATAWPAGPTRSRSSRSSAAATSTRSRRRSGKYEIDCDYERTGVIEVANTFHPPSYLARGPRGVRPADHARAPASSGSTPTRCRPQVHSPIYTGGLWMKDNCAIVDPARLVWGLKAPPSSSACASTRTPRRPSSSATASG